MNNSQMMSQQMSQPQINQLQTNQQQMTQQQINQQQMNIQQMNQKQQMNQQQMQLPPAQGQQNIGLGSFIQQPGFGNQQQQMPGFGLNTVPQQQSWGAGGQLPDMMECGGGGQGAQPGQFPQ